mmetsp:Transcript_153/g.368  ORF Transcript_153/g.368 Transcript_153/m.368 type:complete len:384 (-) Transcript_153:471-1622(-)
MAMYFAGMSLHCRHHHHRIRLAPLVVVECSRSRPLTIIMLRTVSAFIPAGRRVSANVSNVVPNSAIMTPTTIKMIEALIGALPINPSVRHPPRTTTDHEDVARTPPMPAAAPIIVRQLPDPRRRLASTSAAAARPTPRAIPPSTYPIRPNFPLRELLVAAAAVVVGRGGAIPAVAEASSAKEVSALPIPLDRRGVSTRLVPLAVTPLARTGVLAQARAEIIKVPRRPTATVVGITKANITTTPTPSIKTRSNSYAAWNYSLAKTTQVDVSTRGRSTWSLNYPMGWEHSGQRSGGPCWRVNGSLDGWSRRAERLLLLLRKWLHHHHKSIKLSVLLNVKKKKKTSIQTSVSPALPKDDTRKIKILPTMKKTKKLSARISNKCVGS